VGRPDLQAAATAGGAGLAPLTWREAYQRIVTACAQSAVVTGIEPLLLDEPMLKLRAHLGALAFVDVSFNAETGKTSFALIQNRQRILGADNTRGWHIHPFDSPESHHPCAEMSFEDFLRQVEQNKEKWSVLADA
jgi:hypothetical protein